MKRQVIIGGAIVVISVASAAAYGIVQGRWFGSSDAAKRGAGRARHHGVRVGAAIRERRAGAA